MGVHIADVSFFVKSGSALDLEAAHRGTTVYLVDKRIDMIPTDLSSNLCSLIGDKERLTFSVIWIVDSKTCEIKETKFSKSIIRSKAALTYKEAQLKIDSSSKDEVSESLRRLNNLAKVLKKQRIEKGALVLASAAELRFIDVESEANDCVTEIESKQSLETNSMIEEFMLLANIAVAKKLYDDLPGLAVLRFHPNPAQANYEPLVRAFKGIGAEINTTDGKALADSLDRAIDPKNPYLNTMLRMMTVTCMSQARYFCSGCISNDEVNFKHFGIAAPIYTHFTSPIRRYADLLVHRLLSFSVGAEHLDSKLFEKNKVSKICDHINDRNKNARWASRSSTRFHTLLYVKNSPRIIEEEAFVLNIKKNCLIIFIPPLSLQMQYFLEDTQWSFDEEALTQKDAESGCILKQFDRLIINLVVVDKSNDFKRGFEQVQILIVEPPIDKRMKV